MNQVYMLWKVKFYYNSTQSRMFGPYCPVCGLDLEPVALHAKVFRCDDCKINYPLPAPREIICSEAMRRHTAKLISQYQPINLDLPPTKIKIHDEDDNYFISGGLTQKDGRRLLMILVGEKKGKQSEKDYAQLFFDIDQEQVRHHVANKLPGEILVGLVAEFKGSKTKVDFKETKTE